jgi:3-keto-disaccharide hydrolase/FG-GAP-like repeat
MSNHRSLFVTAVVSAALVACAAVVAQNYIPDTLHKGTSLAGWHVMGDASWRAENGEYVGTPKGADGGWLVFDKSLQDTGVFARFRCTGGCKTGVLLRAEKTATGFKGIYLALTGEDVASYAVTLDANGKELSRERLRPAGGQVRIAPAPAPAAPGAATGRAGAGGGGRAGGRGREGQPANLPLSPPVGGLKPDDWNHLEILLDANIVRPFLNDSSIATGAADDAFGRYGPVALYIGGAGEVRYKDLATSDLGLKTLPLERISPNFRMQRVSEFYYSWGAAAADFDHDGVNDIAAGPYYYLGPDFTKSREIYLAQTVNPSVAYPNDCMQNFAADFTGDGWADVICMGAIGQPLHLYVNPKGEPRRWDKYDVVPQVQKEVSLVADIDGDGKPDFVYGGGGFLRYAKPDPANPTGQWVVHDISPQGPWGAGHGLGVGDINGDKKPDVVDPYGWWEQPAAGAASGVWTYHPEAFGLWTGHASPGGAEMGVYDVNGDGLTDVVAVLQAHGLGLAWFEQKKDPSGKISFVQHMVMGDFSTKNAGGVTVSELHGSTVGDVDGDGIPDFIAGKRYWSHLDDYTDPDPYGPPVLYVFRTSRNPKAPGGAEFVPELVHNRSGAGNAVTAFDVNKDGFMDILSATDRGLFVFFGKARGGAAAKK